MNASAKATTTPNPPKPSVNSSFPKKSLLGSGPLDGDGDGILREVQNVAPAYDSGTSTTKPAKNPYLGVRRETARTRTRHAPHYWETGLRRAEKDSPPPSYRLDLRCRRLDSCWRTRLAAT